jgi:acyl-CoA synthetase (AMP-forming)/AMP-acid ligase II
LPAAEVVVVPLGAPDAAPLPAGAWGELLVAAPWMRAGYDRRWGTDHEASVERDGRRFHRTGDVGYLDADGRLFQLGRAVHVVHLPDGPVASVAAEQPAALALGRPVAAVGIGPLGAQAMVIVVDESGRPGRSGRSGRSDGSGRPGRSGRLRLADEATTAAVRDAADHPVAAVLAGPLPVDVRHRSKVDRTRLAADADRLLAGR